MVPSCGLAGFVIGGGAIDNTLQTLLISVDSQSNCGTPTAADGFLLSPNSGGTITEPKDSNALIFEGVGANWTMTLSGQSSPVRIGGAPSWITAQSIQDNTTTQLITSGSQTIVPPELTILTTAGHTSRVNINSTGSFVMTATPIIAYPGVAGVHLRLRNIGSTLVFRDDDLFSTGLDLENTQVLFEPGDEIELVSTGNIATNIWRETYHSHGYGGGPGNQGLGGSRLVTTNNTATSLFPWDVANSAIASGTCANVDVRAQSQAGTNVARWLFAPCWTVGGALAGNTPNLVFSVGSNSGSPPLGWTVTWDATGTSPFAHVYANGDNTANPVTWYARIEERDPGQ
jgi:hypothetical protein